MAATRWAILAVIGMILGADYAATWMQYDVILLLSLYIKIGLRLDSS